MGSNQKYKKTLSIGQIDVRKKIFSFFIVKSIRIKYSLYIIFKLETNIMPFTDQEYFEVIEKNEIVKKAYENIKQICIDLKEDTNCPEEDLKDFLKFISRQWNK